MASFSLLTKILADFQLGLYLPILFADHATNHVQTRIASLKPTITNAEIL